MTVIVAACLGVVVIHASSLLLMATRWPVLYATTLPSRAPQSVLTIYEDLKEVRHALYS